MLRGMSRRMFRLLPVPAGTAERSSVQSSSRAGAGSFQWEDRCHPRRHPCRSLAGLDDTIRGWICVTRLVRLHGIQVAIGLGQLLRCLQISLFHNWFHIIKQAESIVDCCGFGCCRRLDDRLSSFECLKSVCNCSRWSSFCSRLLNFCSLFLLYQ